MGRITSFAMALALAVAPAAALAQAPAPTAAEAATTPVPAEPTAAPGATVTQQGVDDAAPAMLRGEAEIGQPRDVGIGLQEQFTDVGRYGAWMHNSVLVPLIAAISIFVLLLLVWVVVRYRAAANPTPSRTSHNTVIEVIWTVVPVLILVAICIPSIQLLARQYSPPKADLTIKVTGHQWYWTYDYPDAGDLSFDSVMLSDEEARRNGDPRLLAVDNRLVVPAGKVVKLLVTADDVIHSWAMPSFWVKMDAVPGRINETWFKVDRPGVYYGQCSELCGTKHAFMPIVVEVLPEAQYAQWLAAKQRAAGITPTGVAPTSTSDPNEAAAVVASSPPGTENPIASPTPGVAVPPPATPQGATANEGTNP